MPKRSTPFQAIVRLVREHFAQSGVTITESKLLRDAVRAKTIERFELRIARFLRAMV